MDKITKSFLDTFSDIHDLGQYSESQRFEVFCDHVVLYPLLDTMDEVVDVNLGKNEFGIDGLAIIVNGRLVFAPDEIDEILEYNKYLDVDFVFTQSKPSENINTGEIAKFLVAIGDFAGKEPKTLKSDIILQRRAIFDKIYERATKFRDKRPRVHAFYCYAGKGVELSAESQATVDGLIGNILDMDIFESARLEIMDRSALQDSFKRMSASTTAEITLNKVFSIPEIEGVKESYLGLTPAIEILKLVQGDDGSILKSVFYENIRDFDAKSEINTSIRKTIADGEGPLFSLRNNGITILAPDLTKIGDKFSISNYQIINGCQTSHVIASFPPADLDGIFVPTKIVISDDEDVVSSVIISSNQQNEVKPEQFWSLKKSQKEIEDFFQVYRPDDKLYYERRKNQFAATTVERTRIVSPPLLARQFSSIFLENPHIAGRYYREVVKQVESGEVFADNHKPLAYYLAAYCAYRIEWIFRNTDFDNMWKPFRYSLMHALCRKIAGAPPKANSGKIDAYAEKIMLVLEDPDSARKELDQLEKLFKTVIASKPAYALNRDTARLQTFRDDILAELANLSNT